MLLFFWEFIQISTSENLFARLGKPEYFMEQEEHSKSKFWVASPLSPLPLILEDLVLC